MEYNDKHISNWTKPLSHKEFQNYEDFFAEIYQQMFQRLYNYGMQICGNSNLVKDCIQDLFSELWKNQKILTRIRSVKPYLLKCLKRKIKRTLGKGKHLYIESDFEFEMSYEIKLIQDQRYHTQQLMLHRALKALTKRQREAIFLKFYSSLSYDEVADVMQIKTKATYKLISRALYSLKLALTEPH